MLAWWGIHPKSFDTNDILYDFSKLPSEFKNDIICQEAYKKLEKDDLKIILEIAEKEYSKVNEQKDRIEGKASTIIAQSGFLSALIIAIGTIAFTQLKQLDSIVQIGILFIVLLPILNMFFAILHAIHVISLNYNISYLNLKVLEEKNTVLNVIADLLLAIEKNSIINRNKGTILRFSHYFYTKSLKWILILIIIVPIVLLIYVWLKNSNIDLLSKLISVFH